MIRRDPQQTAQQTHDVVIVGGGIYGVALTLEAARRGLKAALIERDDFGGATSWNSLRILHGGLRYLQSLDLPRFRESVAERRWFCGNFPDLVRPLACLMPLYGRGLKRPGVFRAALLLNDWLSRGRNAGVTPELHLNNGRVLSPDQTLERCRLIERRGLRGAGLWYDAVMINSQRVLIEMLHWACSLGAQAVNYAEAEALLVEDGRAVGVRIHDRIGEQRYDVRGRVVINCAGPWSRQVAKVFDREVAQLFRPSLAFNVLFEREAVSTSALAVQPPEAGAPVYFMQPWRGRIFAGTVHAPWTDGVRRPEPTEAQIEAMIGAINRAVPALGLQRSEVARVYAGLLPTTRDGGRDLAVREVIYDHGENGGPRHLFSVSGVKFTTARHVAERALRSAWSALGGLPAYESGSRRPSVRRPLNLTDPGEMLTADNDLVAPELRRIVDEEAVVRLDDLLYRRTDWAARPEDEQAVAARARDVLRWAGAMDTPLTRHTPRHDTEPRTQQQGETP